ncbi:hypothetical protein Tco_0675309, partial [Tanacetum coccineum]
MNGGTINGTNNYRGNSNADDKFTQQAQASPNQPTTNQSNV